MGIAKSYRDISKANWGTGDLPTIEQINTGSLQRIAAAIEVMSRSHASLINERDFYKRQYEQQRDRAAALRRQVAALRGAMTKLKRKRG